MLESVTFTVMQGHMAVVLGPHRQGKNTLLKLIAGLLSPTHGTIFIPTHLRVLHVGQEPIMMELSLMDNLCFGCPAWGRLLGVQMCSGRLKTFCVAFEMLKLLRTSSKQRARGASMVVATD